MTPSRAFRRVAGPPATPGSPHRNGYRTTMKSAGTRRRLMDYRSDPRRRRRERRSHNAGDRVPGLRHHARSARFGAPVALAPRRRDPANARQSSRGEPQHRRVSAQLRDTSASDQCRPRQKIPCLAHREETRVCPFVGFAPSVGMRVSRRAASLRACARAAVACALRRGRPSLLIGRSSRS